MNTSTINDTRSIPVETLTPEVVTGLVTKVPRELTYELDESFSHPGVKFDVWVRLSYYGGTWNQTTIFKWSTGGFDGRLKADFLRLAPDRRKASVDTMLETLGQHVYDTLKTACDPDKLALMLQEEKAAMEAAAARYRQLEDGYAAERERLEAWLKASIDSGEIVEGKNIGLRLDLVLTNLMTVAGLRMRNRKYDLPFAYDGVTLLFKKGRSARSADGVGPSQTQVVIQLKGFAEWIYADQDGTRVIGETPRYGGRRLNGYTRTIPAERLQRIESALQDLDQLDRLVDIMTNGRGVAECICCGKQLTDPVSQARWVGPECVRHFQGVFTFEDDGIQTQLLNAV
jgi:hypothetical protein